MWLDKATGITKSDVNSVQILILPAGPPKVFVTPLLRKKQNSNEKIAILGGIEESWRTVRYTWVVLEEDAIELDFRVSSSTGHNSRNLVVKPDTLTPGVVYRFGCIAADEFGAGAGEIEVVMNTPPSGGSYFVRPPNGIAGNTSFTLVAKNWVDDPEDLPLKYYFGFIKPQLGTGGAPTLGLT